MHLEFFQTPLTNFFCCCYTSSAVPAKVFGVFEIMFWWRETSHKKIINRDSVLGIRTASQGLKNSIKTQRDAW